MKNGDLYVMAMYRINLWRGLL